MIPRAPTRPGHSRGGRESRKNFQKENLKHLHTCLFKTEKKTPDHYETVTCSRSGVIEHRLGIYPKSGITVS